MKKNFFKWAVALTALSVALAFSSCGEEELDDENDNKQEQNDNNNQKEESTSYEFKNNKIAVEAGKTYVFSMDQKSVDGEFTVTAATPGSVTFTIKGKTITLSDAGKSYLSIANVEMGQAEAVSKPGEVLFCLLSSTQEISSATNAKKAEIAAGANNIFFDVKK